MRKKKKTMLLLVMVCLFTLLPVQYASATYTRSGVSSQLNTLINQYVGKTFSGTFAGGSQCYGFAHMIFDNLFARGSRNVGSYQTATKWKFLNPASDITTVGVLDPGYSLASLERLLEKAAPGDYVQVRRRKTQGPHSMIVVNVDAAANTIEIFDSNSKEKLLNRHYTQSFQTFFESNDGVSVYRYSDYDPGVDPVYKTGRYRVSTSSGLPLILRGDAGTNSENKASIPNGTELVVTQVKGCWGNVCYNGIYGWVHLGYCTYIGEAAHEHSYTEFVFIEAEHPHYKCYKCSGCDSVVRNTDQPTLYESCASGACKYTGLGDSFYARILKADSGLPLVNEEPGVNVGNVALGTENGSRASIWKFVKQGNDAYAIYSCADGQALDMENGTAEPVSGKNLSVYTYWSGAHQQWYISCSGTPWWSENCYSFEPLCNTGLAIDMKEGENTAGTNAWVYTKNNTAAQKFQIELLDAAFTLKEPELLIYPGSSLADTVIRWNSVDHAVAYDIKITESSGKTVVDKKDYKSTSFSYALPVGSYKVKVTAKNMEYEDLTASSQEYSIEVKQESGDKVASVRLGNKEYTLYDYGMDWDQAKAFCEAQGGKLLEILNEEEQKVIEKLLNKGTYDFYWLGMTDEETEGSFQWVSGARMVYTNWAAGEPNNAGNGENYGSINKNGTWNDVTIKGGLDGRTGFILEKAHIPVTDVKLGYDELYIPLGAAESFWKGTILPSNATDGGVENLTFTFADESLVSRVYQTLTLQGKKTGTTTVTAASADGPSDTAKIIVFDMTLQEKELELNVGDKTSLTASIMPAEAADKLDIKWRSSDESVVSADLANGKLTAKACGDAVITAEIDCGASQKLKKTCLVHVRVPAESMAITPVDVQLKLNEEKQLSLEFFPENSVLLEPEYWFSGDPSVVTVDHHGKIQAVGYGKTQIYAASGSLRAMCYVTVEQELTGITVEEEIISLTEGETVSISVNPVPAGASLNKVTFTVADDKIALTDSDVYTVTGVKGGNTKLKITADNGKYTLVLPVIVSHKWNEEPTILKEATFEEEGEKAIVCALCGKEAVKEGSRVPIPKLKAPETETETEKITEKETERETEKQPETSAPQPETEKRPEAPTPAPQPETEKRPEAPAPAPQPETEKQTEAPTSAPQPETEKRPEAPAPAPQPETEKRPEAPAPAPQPAVKKPKPAGSVLKVSGSRYKVTAATSKKRTVTYLKDEKKRKNLQIPKTVRVDGITYTVTAIGTAAFKNRTDLISVKIPATVTTVGTSAFRNCRRIKKITGGDGIQNFGDLVFSGCTSLERITLGKNVRKLGKSVFKGDKKLKSIVVKSGKLKTVGRGTFSGIYKKAVIRVPKKYLKRYRKILLNKGQGKAVRIIAG